MYIKRAIEDQVTYLSEHFPAVVITGARQTGKTTLIKKRLRRINSPAPQS